MEKVNLGSFRFGCAFTPTSANVFSLAFFGPDQCHVGGRVDSQEIVLDSPTNLATLDVRLEHKTAFKDVKRKTILK